MRHGAFATKARRELLVDAAGREHVEASSTTAPAELCGRIDGGIADLAADAGDAPEEFTVEADGPADAGADRDHQHAGGWGTSTRLQFGEGRHVDIVVKDA